MHIDLGQPLEGVKLASMLLRDRPRKQSVEITNGSAGRRRSARVAQTKVGVVPSMPRHVSHTTGACEIFYILSRCAYSQLCSRNS